VKKKKKKKKKTSVIERSFGSEKDNPDKTGLVKPDDTGSEAGGSNEPDRFSSVASKIGPAIKINFLKHSESSKST
jgi:hypothetical protein